MKNLSKKHILLISSAVLFVALVSITATAGADAFQPFGHMTPDRMNTLITWKVNDTLDELDATDRQRERVLQVKDRLFKEGLALHREGMEPKRALLEQWVSGNPDLDKARELMNDKFERGRAFADKALEAITELHDILTPEQRAKLAEKIRKHMDEHEAMMRDAAFVE